MAIIPQNRLQEKRLQKLPVEWNDLETERERKIAMVHFWKGFHFAEEWRKMEEELRERGEIE